LIVIPISKKLGKVRHPNENDIKHMFTVISTSVLFSMLNFEKEIKKNHLGGVRSSNPPLHKEL
jgi:hypothetical protein